MRCSMLIFVGAFLATLGHADDLVITSLGRNGEVTWTYPTNDVREYRVEWCSDLTKGLWCDLEGGLRGIAPTGGTMWTTVPMSYRIKACGQEPTNMVYVPAGWFDMGNCMGPDEGLGDELPLHPVYVSGFFMDQYEVRSNLWAEVYDWATRQLPSYGFDNVGSAKNVNYPVCSVNWYDCVKWANARSQKEGLTACYYTDAGLSTVYKSGTYDPYVDWAANGYRLPTEAEWEKAARGGASGHRFPWADDTIGHGRANYNAGLGSSYDLSSGGYHPIFSLFGVEPYSSPVGSFASNGYGLYDMSGNMWEWCWDWYLDTYYSTSPETDPRGPASGSPRTMRGGGWVSGAPNCRVAKRAYVWPDTESDSFGFRLVRAAQ